MNRNWPRRCARSTGATMIEGLNQLLEDTKQPGLVELRRLFGDLLGGPDAAKFDRVRVKLAVELIAQVHTRFAQHPLLGEVRRHGGDLGIQFYLSNVRDAIYSLVALRPPAVEVEADLAAVRDRLLQRMYQ